MGARFDDAEYYDAMLFAPMVWFEHEGRVTAAFRDSADAWAWAITHPDTLVHPNHNGAQMSATARPASEVTRFGYTWFEGWTRGKALARVI